MNVDLDLLRQYNQSLPRYTSYPTAPHFGEGGGRQTLRAEVSPWHRRGPVATPRLDPNPRLCPQPCVSPREPMERTQGQGGDR